MTQLPYSIQIELVEGCNRFCQFCGIRGMWRSKEDKVVKFMSMEMAENVAKELNSWFGGKGKRIEFALQGEPTLNSNIVEIIFSFRKFYPSSQMLVSTNGMTLNEKLIERLFSSGLNILLVEAYDNDYDKKQEFLKKICLKENIQFEEFYKEYNPYTYRNSKLKVILLMDDIGKRNKEKLTRTLFNHAGNVDFSITSKYGVLPVKEPLSKTCTNVFRELVIKQDGVVTACCMDWNRELIVGKFPEESLKDIWNGKTFNAIRQLLYDRKRYVTPCNKCDYFGGVRQGLKENPDLDLSDDELINILSLAKEKYSQLHGKYATWQVKKPRQLQRSLFDQ